MIPLKYIFALVVLVLLLPGCSGFRQDPLADYSGSGGLRIVGGAYYLGVPAQADVDFKDAEGRVYRVRAITGWHQDLTNQLEVAVLDHSNEPKAKKYLDSVGSQKDREFERELAVAIDGQFTGNALKSFRARNPSEFEGIISWQEFQFLDNAVWFLKKKLVRRKERGYTADPVVPQKPID